MQMSLGLNTKRSDPVTCATFLPLQISTLRPGRIPGWLWSRRWTGQRVPVRGVGSRAHTGQQQTGLRCRPAAVPWDQRHSSRTPSERSIKQQPKEIFVEKIKKKSSTHRYTTARDHSAWIQHTKWVEFLWYSLLHPKPEETSRILQMHQNKMFFFKRKNFFLKGKIFWLQNASLSRGKTNKCVARNAGESSPLWDLRCRSDEGKDLVWDTGEKFLNVGQSHSLASDLPRSSRKSSKFHFRVVLNLIGQEFGRFAGFYEIYDRGSPVKNVSHFSTLCQCLTLNCLSSYGILPKKPADGSTAAHNSSAISALFPNRSEIFKPSKIQKNFI